MIARNVWSEQLYTSFKQDIQLVRQAHTTTVQTPGSTFTQSLGVPKTESIGISPKPGGTAPTSRTMRLLESCFVLRLEDYNIYRVSTANDNKRSMPKRFLSSDKKQLLLPSDMSSIHVEYTEYYFPEGYNFPGKLLCVLLFFSVLCSLPDRLVCG